MSSTKDHWNRKRTLAEYRAENARPLPKNTTVDMAELAALSRAWLEALSPGKRRTALEAVKRALLRVVEIHDPQAYPWVLAAYSAQSADQPIPRVRK